LHARIFEFMKSQFRITGVDIRKAKKLRGATVLPLCTGFLDIAFLINH
jgi:hypothetical protein